MGHWCHTAQPCLCPPDTRASAGPGTRQDCGGAGKTPRAGKDPASPGTTTAGPASLYWVLPPQLMLKELSAFFS